MSHLHRTPLLTLVAALLLTIGCTPRSSGSSALTSTWRAEAATSSEPAPSIYDLTSAWTDQQGVDRPISSLRGRPRAVAMIYTHCTATCPLALGEMKRIAAATDSSVGLVLVSLDPAHDTPATLAAYAREHGLDASRWTLFSGRDGDVRELAAALGIRYRALGPDAIAHSNVITLVDANGVVVHQQSGFDGTADAIRIARALPR
jgi:protein SCO1